MGRVRRFQSKIRMSTVLCCSQTSPISIKEFNAFQVSLIITGRTINLFFIGKNVINPDAKEPCNTISKF